MQPFSGTCPSSQRLNLKAQRFGKFISEGAESKIPVFPPPCHMSYTLHPALAATCNSTRLGHLLLGLVLVQADGGPEHNFLYICTNVMSFELFDGRNNYFECIADER